MKFAPMMHASLTALALFAIAAGTSRADEPEPLPASILAQAETGAPAADVDQILTHVSDLEAITVADIQRAARQYLRAETAWRGVSVSDNPAAPAAAQ